MAIQPDAPDAGGSREGIALVILTCCAAQMRGIDQHGINRQRNIAVVFSQLDAQPVFAQKLPLCLYGLGCAIHHLPCDWCRLTQAESAQRQFGVAGPMSAPGGPVPQSAV